MVKNNKKILILTTPFRPNVGGVETHLDDLIKEGVNRGINFVILTYQPLVTKAWGKILEKDKRVTIFRLPWIRANLFLTLEKYPALEFIYLSPGIFLTSLIYLLFNYKKISVIHSQGLIAGAVGVFLAKMFNKRVIISTHSVYNFNKENLYSSFVRFLFNQSDHILTLSHQSKEEVLNLEVDKKKVTVFNYWVDQKVFRKLDKRSCRHKLGLPLNAKIVLFVGRLIEVKGIKELIKAASKTRQKINYLIIGDGPLSTYVLENSQKNSQIIFPGRVDNQDLPNYYNAADIMIVPSTHEEGFGRVTLEALSCGLPVIGSNRGGIKESIDETVGILIKVTPNNILRSVEMLFKDKRRLDLMRSNTVKFAKRHYSNRNAEQIFKYYG